jgi:hypothetical protein
VFKLFLQDVSPVRKALLTALDRYDDLMYELDPDDSCFLGNLQDDPKKQARRDAELDLIEEDVCDILQSIGGDHASERLITTLVRAHNTSRARKYIRSRFESDYEPRPWFKRVLLVVAWPFYTAKKLLP